MAKEIICVDLETSGLKSGLHCILSIGAVVQRNVKKDPIREFSALITPTENQWKLASAEALAINGLTWERLVEEGRPFADVRDDFIRFLVENLVSSKKTTYIGQNPKFDLRFLVDYMGNELEFVDFPFNDVVNIQDLYSILANRKEVPVLKSRSAERIAKAIDVEPEPEIHDALEGARLVHRLYNKLVELGARS